MISGVPIAGKSGLRSPRQSAARQASHRVNQRESNDMPDEKSATSDQLPSTSVGLRPYLPRAFGTTWHFRLLHVAGLVVTLPLVAATRLLPDHWRQRYDESVFVETNRAVLTALGFAFMS